MRKANVDALKCKDTPTENWDWPFHFAIPFCRTPNCGADPMKGLIALTLTLAVLLASPVLSVSPVQAQDSSTSSGTYVLELDDNLIYELSRRQGLKSFLPTNKTFDRVLLKYVQTNARTTRSPSIFDPSKEGNVDVGGSSTNEGEGETKKTPS